MRIFYKDAATGERRCAEFVERVEGLVKCRIGDPYSGAARYKLEDGYIVQIPDAAWQECGEIDIEDWDEDKLPLS